jgi:hypothetical protein
LGWNFSTPLDVLQEQRYLVDYLQEASRMTRALVAAALAG